MAGMTQNGKSKVHEKPQMITPSLFATAKTTQIWKRGGVLNMVWEGTMLQNRTLAPPSHTKKINVNYSNMHGYRSPSYRAITQNFYWLNKPLLLNSCYPTLTAYRLILQARYFYFTTKRWNPNGQ